MKTYKQFVKAIAAATLLCLIPSCMWVALREENFKSQDFYGRVVDQDGNPIAGVDVTGELVLNDGTYGGVKTRKFNTQTDKDGLFEFTGISGAGLGVRISKSGYIMGSRGEGYKNPKDEKTSLAERSIYQMWKLRGAEPLISVGIDTHIPHDGTLVAFDMMTGKKTSNGDFRVTLSQYPLEVKHGWDKYDWSVKVEILNGGMQEENDSYPYWAPTDGYQSLLEFNESSNSVKWLGGLPQKMFYIKNAQGQYGLMKLEVFSGRSPTGIQANFTINPSGSRNLEPDLSK